MGRNDSGDEVESTHPDLERVADRTYEELVQQPSVQWGPLVGEPGSDRWVSVQVPGWEGHEVAVLAGIVGGEPRVVGVRVQPAEGVPPEDVKPLTQVGLRSLPLPDLAKAALAARGGDAETLARQARAIAARDPGERHPRAAATPEQVVKVFERFRAAGERAPRKATAEALGVHQRTVDRYRALYRKQKGDGGG